MDHYKDDRVDWSIDTWMNFMKYKTDAEDPKTFDPTFLIKVGSKETRSDTY